MRIYVDRQVPLFLRTFAKRLRGYRTIGYARDVPGFDHEEERDESDLVGGEETKSGKAEKRDRRPARVRKRRRTTTRP